VEHRRSQSPVARQLALLCLASGYFRIWDGHAKRAVTLSGDIIKRAKGAEIKSSRYFRILVKFLQSNGCTVPGHFHGFLTLTRTETEGCFINSYHHSTTVSFVHASLFMTNCSTMSVIQLSSGLRDRMVFNEC
jgi:hypothetical protein